MMDRSTAIAEIKALIEDQNKITVADPDQSLDVDSFTIILILTFAKEKLGRDLDMGKLSFDNFTTLSTIEDALFNDAYVVDQ